jgi:hypothetical protein
MLMVGPVVTAWVVAVVSASTLEPVLERCALIGTEPGHDFRMHAVDRRVQLPVQQPPRVLDLDLPPTEDGIDGDDLGIIEVEHRAEPVERLGVHVLEGVVASVIATAMIEEHAVGGDADDGAEYDQRADAGGDGDAARIIGPPRLRAARSGSRSTERRRSRAAAVRRCPAGSVWYPYD